MKFKITTNGLGQLYKDLKLNNLLSLLHQLVSTHIGSGNRWISKWDRAAVLNLGTLKK